MLYLFEMLKHELHFSIIFLMCVSPNLANDFYSKFHQNDYKIEFQRVELVDYNKSVFNVMEIKTFKYNRTLAVVNMTMNTRVNMSTGLEMTVQFYKFLSNEYRKLPGTNFQVNYCKSLSTNIMGLHIFFKCGNFTTCEIVQETTYAACYIYPDESRYPPYLPSGEFKLEIKLVYNNDIVATYNMYVRIYRPIAIPKKQKAVY